MISPLSTQQRSLHSFLTCPERSPKKDKKKQKTKSGQRCNDRTNMYDRIVLMAFFLYGVREGAMFVVFSSEICCSDFPSSMR